MKANNVFLSRLDGKKKKQQQKTTSRRLKLKVSLYTTSVSEFLTIKDRKQKERIFFKV